MGGQTGSTRTSARRGAGRDPYDTTTRTYGRPRGQGPGQQDGHGDVAFRRTLVVTLLSLVAPGSGHLALRRPRIGRIVLEVYAVLLVAAILLAVFVPHGWWLALAFKPWLLGVVEVLAVAVGVLWAAVVGHAFLLSQPGRIRPRRRGIAVLVALAVCAAVLVPFGVTARYASVQRDLVASLFPPGGSGPKQRLNILLVGGDAAKDRVGVRTDSMIVASIDLATGRTALISLPRNLQHVPMPEGRPREEFPDGFDDLLNAVYRYGAQHPKLEPGSHRPGADLLKQTVAGVLGIPVHYYLLVNLHGFRRIVDALGGVTIRVQQRLPIGGKGGVPVTGYVEPGLQRLDGLQALWYARSRATTSDYDRMTRQRCLLGAIARQADPATVLTRYQRLAAASKQLFQTDIPRSVLSKLVGVAEQAKTQRIESLAFVPPLIDTSDPDWRLIRDKTQQAIDKSMQPTSTKHKGKHKRHGSGGGSGSNASKGAVSVDAACSYH